MITFEDQQCYEKPLAEGGHWICQHLRQFLDSDPVGAQISVRRILVGANKSTEIFVLADRPAGFDPKSISNLQPPLIWDGSRVNCKACWTTLILGES
jgi:hypothetical protein